MDLGLKLWMNLAHDLMMLEFKQNESSKGSQYATAMTMLADDRCDWMKPPYSKRTANEKRNFLLSKVYGLVRHDRCLNYHYVQGSDLFRKL